MHPVQGQKGAGARPREHFPANGARPSARGREERNTPQRRHEQSTNNTPLIMYALAGRKKSRTGAAKRAFPRERAAPGGQSRGDAGRKKHQTWQKWQRTHLDLTLLLSSSRLNSSSSNSIDSNFPEHRGAAQGGARQSARSRARAHRRKRRRATKEPSRQRRHPRGEGAGGIVGGWRVGVRGCAWICGWVCVD